MNQHTCGPYVDRFWSLVHKTDGCWLWRGHIDRKHGYGRMAVSQLGGRWLAHRLAWKITHGRIPRALDLLHRCDNPPCVNPSHLFLGTHRDNMQDAAAKGRTARGTASPKNKLTAEQVLSIRREYVRGVVGCERLGKKYGVSSGAIYHIVTGTNWRHVA